MEHIIVVVFNFEPDPKRLKGGTKGIKKIEGEMTKLLRNLS